jgi:Tfp pilus assembly protein FimT
MNRKIAWNRSGFTLVELVVTASMIMIVAVFAVPSINRYWQYYQLDSATQSLTSTLELARFTAISRNVSVVTSFSVADRYYEVFEDNNGNGVRDPGERLVGGYSLPGRINFSGAGLVGPPASPSGSVGDPVSFNDDRVVFNTRGKLQNGLGSIYLQNDARDASAISYNLAGRMKTYHWDRGSLTWK